MKDGNQQAIVIIHGLITGRDSRILAGLLSDCIVKQKNDIKPTFPFELSPYQFRVISHGKNTAHISTAIAEAIMTLSSLRVITDTRDVDLRQKVKDSGKDWVPFTLIVGDKEMASDNYTINNRYANSTYTISIDNSLSNLAKTIISYLDSDENSLYRLGLPKNTLVPNPFTGILDYGSIPTVFK